MHILHDYKQKGEPFPVKIDFEGLRAYAIGECKCGKKKLIPYHGPWKFANADAMSLEDALADVEEDV